MLNSLVKERNAQQVTVKEVADLLLDGTILAVVRGRQEVRKKSFFYTNCLVVIIFL